jgi:transglutaminase-like putative cysteine protease
MMTRFRSSQAHHLNALYVALARASGLPARDVYGIRVAKSELGYQSLGASTENGTKAQHCRAEVYLEGHGWVPEDPADVRKVVLEEPPGNRPLDDDMVNRARTRLFGSWYPQAETAEGRLDCLDAANFRYEITSKEVTT